VLIIATQFAAADDWVEQSLQRAHAAPCSSRRRSRFSRSEMMLHAAVVEEPGFKQLVSCNLKLQLHETSFKLNKLAA
jgi:hypothetical protein